MSADRPPLFLDLRPLQDPRYQWRGVGAHLQALLRSRARSSGAAFEIVGLAAPELPPLPAGARALCDRVHLGSSLPRRRRPAVFLDGSPMTHDPTRTLRFLRRPDTLAAAVVYDFIPLDRSGYLPTPESRIDWLLRLRRLRSFDLFFPISEFTGARLRQLLNVTGDRICVTGACARASLYPPEPPGGRPAENRFNDFGRRPYFFTVGGDDRRKNVETAAWAVAQLGQRTGGHPRLLVASHFDAEYKSDILRIGKASRGRGVVEFLPTLSDEELRDAYAGCQAVIAPSHIEGFSLPIVEAAANGAPVLASDCDAQRELIGNPAALFPSNAPEELVERLEKLQRSPELRDKLRQEQSGLAARFRDEAVASRFWTCLQERFARRFCACAPSVSRRRKPLVAFVTPYPPDRSGIAPYTSHTMAAAAEHFEIDLFTDAPRPLVTPNGIQDKGGINPGPYLDKRYDAVVSVMGNSPFHLPILREYERYGGTCILHDSRLTHLYHYRLGRSDFVRMAERIVKRDVSKEEIESALRDEEGPTQFVEDVVALASPLIVHSDRFRQIVEERHGAPAFAAPFCPNAHFSKEETTVAFRGRARARLGLAPNAFVVSSFGLVDVMRKGLDHCVMALYLLRSWGVPAELHLVGAIDGGERQILKSCSDRFDVTPWVRLHDRFVDEGVYRDYLLGSDAGVQFRSYSWGQPSAALADAISAGLPCVADRDLADACDAPPYVRTTPSSPSHLLIAEALFEIYELGRERVWEEERRRYLQTHDFGAYAARLAEVLQLA